MNASKFIGFQSIHCIVGYLGLFALLFIVALAGTLIGVIVPLHNMLWAAFVKAITPPNGALIYILLPVLAVQITKLVAVSNFNGHRNIAFSAIADYALMVRCHSWSVAEDKMELGALLAKSDPQYRLKQRKEPD